MSGNSSDNSPSNSDSIRTDPNFSVKITDSDPKPTPVVTRSQTRAKSELISDNKNYHIVNLIDLDQTNSEANIDMSELSLETAIKLIPHYNGQNDEEIYSFFKCLRVCSVLCERHLQTNISKGNHNKIKC